MEAVKGGEVRISEMQIQIEVLKQIESSMKLVINALQSENLRLRTRANNQRTELRRLNRRLGAMWEGVRFSHKVRTDMLMEEFTRQVISREVDETMRLGPLRSRTIVEAERPE